MAEKTSQTNSSSNNLPSVPAVAPTSDTPYIQPIIGKLGYDTEHPDIFGIGASPDNGVSFRVFASFDGLVFNDNDIDAIWDNGTSEKVKSEVNSATAEIPAVKSAADEAVKKADSAIASSKVNSDAIVAQSEAISEVKAAMDSATAEIQQTASNAASDAAKIRADVAQVQNEVDTAKAANSASVEALKSDVSAAKQDLADVHDSLTKAQAAAEESQKAIDKSIAKINSDIEQDRKDIASAQQANADTAKQLDDYSKQAQDQGKTIKSIQDKQDGFTATLADVQGNVTQVSDKVDGLSASLKDAQDNVASIKAQADQLSATLTDHAKSIATLTASAKDLSSTLEDAGGRLSKVEQTAQTNSSTLSDVQGDLSQVKQDATTLTATLKDAQGNISTLQQKADSVSAQLDSAQGDIASLQTDVTGIKATLASHEGDIHTLQADSKTLKDDMQDAQGDISTLKKTSTDVTSELKDHAGRISKAEQTASTLTNEFSDQDGRLSKVEQTATGTQQTVANQQGQINSIQTDVSGIHETITGQGNQIANINVTLGGLNTKYEGVSGDLNNLKSQVQWATVTSAVDLNNIKTPCHEFLKGTVTNAPNEVSWWYLTVEGSNSGRITQTVIADQSNNRYTRRWADGWSAWVKDATQTDVTALSNRITTNSTQITQNKSAIALKADQTVVDAVKNTVKSQSASLSVLNNQIATKVTSADVEKTIDGKGYVTKDFVESSITQKANTLSESIAKNDGQIQNITASIDGLQSTVKGKADISQVTQLSNSIASKVSQDDYNTEISQLSKDINLRVQKGDLISQINLEAGQTLIESKKFFLDADTIVFSKNSKAFIPDAAIENLSLDKLTTGSLKVPLADDNGNAISLDESGITINSALSPVTWIPFYGKSDDQSGFYLSLSSKGMKFVNHFVYGKDTQKQIGAKSDDYTFMDIQPDVLHYRDGSTDNVNIPSGLTIYVPQETSSSLGPASPGGFFAMGYKNSGSALHGQDIKKGVEIAYVNKEINGWLEGFHVETNMFVHPRGADHGIRFAWVSWSAWDFGERYPAIVNDTTNWGGVAFPKSGAVTLFNATGKYYTPDKDTGHGAYSDYQ